MALLALPLLTLPLWGADKTHATVDVRSYGAKCDGVTDDSKALQSALSASIENSAIMTLPSGVCYFKTGLSTTKGPHIRGEGEMGRGASILKYDGRGTALTISDPGKWIYTPVLENLGIQSTGSADVGLRCDSCSDARIDNLAIGANPSSHFNVALDLSNSNGVFIEHPIIAYNTKAILLIDTSAIDVQRGDFFAITDSVLTICGKSTWDGLRDSWIEMVDYAVNIDDSICKTPTTVETLRISGNAFLFNGGISLYKHQLSLQITNASKNRRFVVDQLLFTQNHVLMAAGLSATSYPIDITLAQGQRGYANLIVADSLFAGASSGIAGCDKPGVSITYRDNRSYTKAGDRLSDDCALPKSAR